LEANNYKVLSACDGKQGIQQAQQHKPDLIVMDIMMPNVSGGEAVKLLKGEALEIGYNHERYTRHFFNCRCF
jgi:CheY-like chemotaxis protein